MPPFSPGDILITLRTCGDLRRGDVVTVSGTCADGEYLYLDGYERQAFRSDAFMVAVRRPWHAWADPEWERRAREAAERFVREGLVAQSAEYEPSTQGCQVCGEKGWPHYDRMPSGIWLCSECHHAIRTYCSDPRDADLTTASMAMAAMIRAQAFADAIHIAETEEELDGEIPAGVRFAVYRDPAGILRDAVRATKRGIVNRLRALAEKETSR